MKGNSCFTPEQIEHRRKIDGGKVWVGKFSGVCGRCWDGEQAVNLGVLSVLRLTTYCLVLGFEMAVRD